MYHLPISSISPALAYVYEDGIIHIFNSDNEAELFYAESSSNGVLVKAHTHGKKPIPHKACKLICSEPLWLYVSHYNGCTNETVCTNSLLKHIIDDEAKNPYFDRSEIFCPADFRIER